MTVSDPLIRREDRDGVALVLLNRPRQRNALRYESWTELSEVLHRVVADDLRGVVLAGADGFFCAGGDLKTGPAHGTGPLGPAGRVEHAQRVLEQLKAVPVPTIAAIEERPSASVGAWRCRATWSCARPTRTSPRRSWLALWFPTAGWRGA